MIQLKTVSLPAHTLTQLQSFQNEVNKLRSFKSKSTKAKEMFSRKNIKSNATFNEVKKAIAAMCNSTRRCVYCEDSLADEVEHIYPKDLYPDKCFVWDNYIYACGPCNGPKNNLFAIFLKKDGKFKKINPPSGTPATKPPAGDAVIINPRTEDPLKFAMLNLTPGSFQFIMRKGLKVNDQKRYEYTFETILQLNSANREPIRQARENAYENYKSRLERYVHQKKNNAPGFKLDTIKKSLLAENHPTVWKEMQRYYKEKLLIKVDPELKQLFDAAQETLSW